MNVVRLLSSIAVGAMGAATFVGCQQREISESAALDNSLRPHIAENPIGKAASPGPNANLLMAGMSIPVQVETDHQGSRMDLKLRSNDEVIDREVYYRTDGNFTVAYAAGEAFSPPIPILQVPMVVGDSWDWQGAMVSHKVAQGARAKVTTALGKVDVGDGTDNGVRVNVQLEMIPDSPGPSIRRTMTFWIVEGKGVVRREFGPDAVREPISR